MKKGTLLLYLYIYGILLLSNLFATNELSVLTDQWGSTKPGYIDEAILVLEPHGGYFEQTLYLKYSDNNQFPNNQHIEIVHRFELPTGSVVNDMWLWIADSAVQAEMYDTWTATQIYDSIVTNKRDPALLKKKGPQYALHVYPLVSGSYREVKMNMITPVRWLGETAAAELPFRMLNANNALVKPLRILFRQKRENWGQPKIYELPNIDFTHLSDSLGYTYYSAYIEDISQLNSLKIIYDTDFKEGKFVTAIRDTSQHSYFQLGFLPDEFFNLERDTSLKKNLYAIDLSGNKNKNLNSFLPNLKDVMNLGMKEGDQYELIFAGADRLKGLSNGVQNYSEENVDQIISDFANSSFADSIEIERKLNVVFADFHATDSWDFENIDQFADPVYFNNIMDALPSFSKADIIAAYRHGYDDLITQQELNQLLTPLDSLFTRGGRLVTYFDYNRNDGELLARNYIPNLQSSTSFLPGTQTLYRNPDGNIGSNFPEQIDHNFVGTLSYDDPAVKKELVTSTGEPVIISKKIRNGLLVVVNIWQITDDGAMRSLMSPPTLGLNKVSQNLMLEDLLTYIKSEQENKNFNNCILMSNSDSVYTEVPTNNILNNYLSSLTSIPKFNTINLLNGEFISPPSITVDNNLYYGSGYLLSDLSYRTGGLHFETYQNDWDYIKALSNYDLNPLMEELSMDVVVDEGVASLIELREINPVENDPNKPLFFVADTDGQNKVEINLSATFEGIENPIEKNIEFQFANDSTGAFLIPALLANEELKDMFTESSYDTTAIVNLSMKHNLLTDYTALLVLEPNDSTIYDPGDDGGDPTDIQDEINDNGDSLSVELYPNPFNNLVNINLKVGDISKVNVTIYNILGQRVNELAKDKIISGSLALTWDGRNSFGASVSTGFYILRVEIIDINSKKREFISKKLLYLK